MNRLTLGKTLAVSATVLLSTTLGAMAPAYAATSTQPLQITPLCSDAAAGVSKWNVTNLNASNVELDWNTKGGAVHKQTIAPGLRAVSTSYVNQYSSVKFVADGVSQIMGNPSVCNTAGTVNTSSRSSLQQNLAFHWNSRNSLTISTANNAPLSAPVTLNLASFVLPSNYNGDFFGNNKTAVSQTLFDNTQFTLANTGNSFKPVTVTVAMPPACDNVQVDLYMGTEVIKTITSSVAPNNGTVDSHGNHVNIVSALYKKTVDTCQTGGKGGSTVKPVTHVLAASTKKPELANTGTNTVVTTVAALGIMTAALLIGRRKPTATSEAAVDGIVVGSFEK